MMAWRHAHFNGFAKDSQKMMGIQMGCNSQRLSSHLAARASKLARRLHGLKCLVQREAGIKIVPCSPRAQDGNGVCGSAGSFQISPEKGLNICHATHGAGLDTGFQAKGVRISAGGEKPIRKLKQAQKAIYVHADARSQRG